MTVWRELPLLDHADIEVVEKARQAADKSDWAGFIKPMNGPCARRSDQPIKTAKWLEFDQKTGECLDSPVNQYGELARGKLFGIYAQGQYWITRALRWEIKRPKKVEPKVNADRSWLERLKQLTQFREATAAEIATLPDDTAYTWEKLSAEVLPPPWCSVNNCTRSQHLPQLRKMKSPLSPMQAGQKMPDPFASMQSSPHLPLGCHQL